MILFPKKNNFGNYDALVSNDPPQSDDKILVHIAIDDLRPSEPIQGSFLFQCGRNKPLEARFLKCTKNS